MNHLTVLLALAPDPPADVDPSTGKGPEWGKAAPIGLLVILLLCIAVLFLLRSMTRRINRVQGEFDARERAAIAEQPVPSSDDSELDEAAEIGTEADPEPGSSGLVNERSG
jgi:hypothetical protein